jgi:creatinine amidohydrolase/Fe(II)-dependent formamide hydrolase-like protein
MDAMRRSHEVYGFITDVSELCDDGWFGNPGWASADRAAKFTTVVADGVLELIDTVLKARDIRRDIRRPQGEKE